LHKADKPDSSDPVTLQVVPLFHPLEQSWREHFELESDGTCVGRTPVGRATTAALRMNDALPKTARAIQLSMNIL
jgi:hypothetical protein